MKCYWCQKELQEIEDRDPTPGITATKVLECPEVHCLVSLDDKEQIQHYHFYMDHNGQRYKVIGNRKDGTTTFWHKVGPRPWSYGQILSIKRFLLFKPDKDGVLEGPAVFNKLKTLLVFS